MAIHVTCPSCKAAFKTDDSAAGKRAKCPNCAGPIQIPVPLGESDLIDEPAGMDETAAWGFTDDELALEPPVEVEKPNEGRRPCPMCGEMILNDAIKCRFCGEIFDPTLKKQARRQSEDDGDSNLSTGEIVLAILCSGIGCILGIIWMIQGKPKGAKMVGISLAAGVVWNIISALLSNLGNM